MMESYIGPEVLGFWEVLMPGGKRFTDSQPIAPFALPSSSEQILHTTGTPRESLEKLSWLDQDWGLALSTSPYQDREHPPRNLCLGL
jgi:hypothetical protein